MVSEIRINFGQIENIRLRELEELKLTVLSLDQVPQDVDHQVVMDHFRTILETSMTTG